VKAADVRSLGFVLVLASAGFAHAQAPVDAPVATQAREHKPRSARLLAEGLSVGVGGVVLPMASYLGLTAGLQSFVGFFAGFASATVFGALIAPIAVIIAGHLMGAEGGTGRAIVGAVAGLLVGLLIGLPLATLPGAGYLAGLALAWVMPSVGTMIAFEWGRAPPDTGGTVVARF
jgi:hypothetical protein